MKLALRLAVVALVTIALAAVFLLDQQQGEENYTGETKDGEPHGFGIWKHSGGAYYAGWFEEGLRHGRGTWIHPDGIRYAGEWQAGKYHGRGTLIMPGGARYDGKWQEGEKHGKGIYRYPNGNVYTGHWENDRRDGYGILEKANGYTYKGQWSNGLEHGKGTAVYPDGTEYHGQFVRGSRHGEGTLIYPDGSVFEGTFAADKKHGQGKLTCPEGTVKEGEWSEGRLQEVPIENLTIEPFSLSLVAGGASATLDLEISPEDATAQEVTWESSDPDVAEVSDGEVRPLQAGSATITATTACETHTAVCTVEVGTSAVPVTGVSLDRSSITMRVDETAHLTARVRPQDATNLSVSWSSSDSDIAAVYQEGSRRGAVRAFEPGEVFITVTSADGGYTARCQVTVLPKEDPSDRVVVPRLIGKSVEEARDKIDGAGFYMGDVSKEYHRTAPEGQVISQNPAIGAMANRGSAVHLVISKGPLPEDEPEEEPEEEEEEENEDEEPEEDQAEEEEPSLED